MWNYIPRNERTVGMEGVTRGMFPQPSMLVCMLASCESILPVVRCHSKLWPGAVPSLLLASRWCCQDNVPPIIVRHSFWAADSRTGADFLLLVVFPYIFMSSFFSLSLSLSSSSLPSSLFPSAGFHPRCLFIFKASDLCLSLTSVVYVYLSHLWFISFISRLRVLFLTLCT